MHLFQIKTKYKKYFFSTSRTLLTKEVTKPLPKERFIEGDELEHFAIGLNNTNSINNKYIWNSVSRFEKKITDAIC